MVKNKKQLMGQESTITEVNKLFLKIGLPDRPAQQISK
jgi:hypothetical protein